MTMSFCLNNPLLLMGKNMIFKKRYRFDIIIKINLTIIGLTRRKWSLEIGYIKKRLKSQSHLMFVLQFLLPLLLNQNRKSMNKFSWKLLFYFSLEQRRSLHPVMVFTKNFLKDQICKILK